MRKLILIRHAKSSWKHPNIDDHDRPLNKRGKRDVERMPKYFKDREEALDQIYSSTARRATCFAKRISEAFCVPISNRSELYTFSADALFQFIRQLPSEVNRLAIVGHNPAITSVANRLLADKFHNISTSGIVAINLELDEWHNLEGVVGSLDYYIYPKLIY